MPVKPGSPFSARAAIAVLAASALCNAAFAQIGPGAPPSPPSAPSPDAVSGAAKAAAGAAAGGAPFSISSIRFHHGGTTIYTNSQGVLFVRGTNVAAPGVSVAGTGMGSSSPRPDLDATCVPPNCATFNVQTQSSTGVRPFTLRAPAGRTASSSYTVVAAPTPAATPGVVQGGQGRAVQQPPTGQTAPIGCPLPLQNGICPATAVVLPR